MDKLVSIITGTYNRPELLEECINNVRQQTYSNIEHCVVHDGPASEQVREVMGQAFGSEKQYNQYLKWIETGRQWSQFLSASMSTVPYQVAQWLASGDYLMWLADDERMEPGHVQLLVSLLEEKKVDFVYSSSRIWFNPDLGLDERHAKDRICFSDPPRCGTVISVLYRAELLDYRGFTTHIGSGTDWDQVDYWMKAGATWAALDKITLTHRVDKIGEGPDFRPDRQPLAKDIITE